MKRFKVLSGIIEDYLTVQLNYIHNNLKHGFESFAILYSLEDGAPILKKSEFHYKELFNKPAGNNPEDKERFVLDKKTECFNEQVFSLSVWEQSYASAQSPATKKRFHGKLTN